MEAGDDRAVQEIIDSLDPGERAAVFTLWADELGRGWIPKRTDLEAALHVVRSRQP